MTFINYQINYQIPLQINCTSLHFLQQYKRIFIVVQPHYHLGYCQDIENFLGWLNHFPLVLICIYVIASKYQFSSVTQSCPTLCDPMNHSTSGLPVHHQLPEFTQTHVHRVGDAIQLSHPLSLPSFPTPNPFQHQGLFQ